MDIRLGKPQSFPTSSLRFTYPEFLLMPEKSPGSGGWSPATIILTMAISLNVSMSPSFFPRSGSVQYLIMQNLGQQVEQISVCEVSHRILPAALALRPGKSRTILCMSFKPRHSSNILSMIAFTAGVTSVNTCLSLRRSSTIPISNAIFNIPLHSRNQVTCSIPSDSPYFFSTSFSM